MEAREMFHDLLSAPNPPMTPPAETLAAARRSQRAHRVRLGASGAVTAAAVVVATLAAVPAITGSPADDGAATEGLVAASPADSAVRVNDGSDLLDAVSSAIPSGYLLRVGDKAATVADVGSLRPGQGLEGVRLVQLEAKLYGSEQIDDLQISITDSTAAADPIRRTAAPPTGDLCARRPAPPGMSSQRTGSGPEDCRTVFVGDEPIRTHTERVPAGAGVGGTVSRCFFASRFGAGFEVSAQICPEPAAPRAGAESPMLTVEQLAAIAARPVPAG
ncbi:hypothetical protein [Plantactinospora sp. GCM10030261]|uniref:hypothetical protein n=1 Tax=Plantactinospora sp. GCM10030261 TaxID=3273420 RepID=UPI003610F866